jgi:hypothetical protein
MKQKLIASLVGGLIIFLWQFLSFAAVNLHEPAQGRTEKQEVIMNFLNSQGLSEGGYYMPMPAKGSSRDEWEANMKANEGKPWALLQYHSKLENTMGMNMVRGYLTDVVIVFLFCWLIGQMRNRSFRNILIAALITGGIVFLNSAYTGSIWYQFFDVWAHLADAVVSWGLVGVWLGWWMNRNVREVPSARSEVREAATV